MMKPGTRNSLAVIVPMYNESASIGPVVREIRLHAPQADVVVIDDGSSDNSACIAGSAGATVLKLPYNLGIGGAVQTGYRYAVSQGYDAVVRMDGDGQHDASDIPALLAPILDGSADVVIGSRFLNGRGYVPSLLRSIGIRFFAILASLITRRRITDPTSGFQACSKTAAHFLAAYTPQDYPEVEGLLLLCRAGFRIQEVAVTMRSRFAGKSSIRKLKTVYYVLKVTLAVLIGLLRPSSHLEGKSSWIEQERLR